MIEEIISNTRRKTFWSWSMEMSEGSYVNSYDKPKPDLTEVLEQAPDGSEIRIEQWIDDGGGVRCREVWEYDVYKKLDGKWTKVDHFFM